MAGIVRRLMRASVVLRLVFDGVRLDRTEAAVDWSVRGGVRNRLNLVSAGVGLLSLRLLLKLIFVILGVESLQDLIFTFKTKVFFIYDITRLEVIDISSGI